MDRNEAKLVLQACRPNGEDDALPVFTEALAQIEQDPELKAWWEAQQAFDRKVAAKVAGLPVPSGLRATIVAGRKIEQLTPRFHLPNWLATAAVVMIFAGVGFHFWNGHSSGIASESNLATSVSHAMGRQHYAEASLAFLGDNGPSLGMMSPDHDQVSAWLKQQNSPVGTIPTKMGSLPSVGCQTFAVQGHTVSLICFSLAGGGIAHLFIVDRGALANPPGPSPEFSKSGSWSTASWSDEGHSYLLATQADSDQLKRLL